MYMYMYIYISCITYYILVNSILYQNQYILSFHINIYSCNRPYYLNKTLYSIQNYLKYYSDKFKNSIIWYDQGTMERYSYTKIFDIYNTFFMNPIGYSYSFELSFSYIPTMFVLVLEEDWVIDNAIYNRLKYKDFITLSINIFHRNDYISGILLRSFPYAKLKKKKIRVKMIDLDIYILEKPFNNFAYINGPSVYRSSILSLIPYYKDEVSVGHWYYNRGYRLAVFNNSGLLRISGGIAEHIFDHIGEKRTKEGICNIFIY